MKKTRYQTNLDWYSHLDFSAYADFVPREGEVIYLDAHEEYCDRNNIPKRLSVLTVGYDSNGPIVGLWYHDNDVQMAKLDASGKRWEHLLKQ